MAEIQTESNKQEQLITENEAQELEKKYPALVLSEKKKETKKKTTKNGPKKKKEKTTLSTKKSKKAGKLFLNSPINQVKKLGRPAIIDEEKVQLLRFAFSVGATDIEAFTYAGVTKRTFYNYQQKNPEFLHLKEELKSNLILKARIHLYNGLAENPDLCLKVLERLTDEYKLNKKQSLEVQTSENQKVIIITEFNE